ncbi:IPT/TIG domain-containing protein [Paenibacillus lautus]|uniref:IPT/TIG domain-containing protein n=1 Tax=Paenibacillus lautus TaxID=1401 RepID=UPI00203C18EA|nr:IPT/TIG domain-containing protein [Paenibacillus lautus]MCM3261537.1 IPT/TIG domain-containing protein [Paenibacillus lautus]
MRKNFKLLVLSFLLVFTGMVGFFTTSEAAVADYVSVTKVVNPTTITVEEEAEVSLNIKGTPPSNVIMPNDVILIIDKSGSMQTDNRINAAKNAAKGFIDLMDMTKHQVGIVGYSSEAATSSLPLTTDTAAAKQFIDPIVASGGTETGYAIDQAITLLSSHRPEAQPVIVIMTDGEANSSQAALERAQAAKDAGIVFYTIALLGPNDNPDTSAPNELLKQMATTNSHHHFVLGSTGLAEIYAAIVAEIGVASAYNVVVSDIVSEDFEIVPGSYDSNIPQPVQSGNTLTWSFLELKNNDLVFKYKIRPVDKTKYGSLSVSTSASVITYNDYAGASRSKAIPSAKLNVKLLPPSITSVEESTGHPLGGETVTINGANFQPNPTVMMGNKTVADVQYINEKQLVIKTVAGIQGPATVKVINTDGQFATGDYTYLADPVVSSYTPNSGPYVGGTSVFLYGDYFMNGMKVKFGDNYATSSKFYNKGYVVVVAPPATVAGPVDLTLENPDGTSLVVPAGYTYDEPIVEKLSITSISPNSGKLAGGEVVYIEGTLLETTSKVFFGDTEVPINTYYSDKKIRVVAPSSSTPGPIDVTIVNDSGETVVVTGGYSYETPPVLPDPTITSIAPNSGQLLGGEIIYIDGTGFQDGMKVYFGDVEVPVNRLYSSSRFRVIVPSSSVAESVDIKVVNPDGKEAVAIGGYTYLTPPPKAPPTITAITPNSGLATGGTLVYIDGTGIDNGATINFGTNSVAIGSYYSATRIRVTAPSSNGLIGSVDVTIINPDGQEFTVPGGYTYLEVTPTITSITPDNGPLAGGDIIYVNGTNFDSKMTLTVDGIEVPVNLLYSSTRFRFIVPARSTPGSVPIVVTLQSGTSATTSYTYNAPPAAAAPVITAISPAYGPLNGGTIVYLDGTGFTATSKILIGTKEVTLNRFYTDTRLRFIVPAGTVLGATDVKVINPDGQESNVVSYEYR